MGVDEQRTIAGMYGGHLVDFLAIAGIGVHAPAQNIEFQAQIVLIILLRERLLGLHVLRIHDKFARREQRAGLAGGYDLTGAFHARRARGGARQNGDPRAGWRTGC